MSKYTTGELAKLCGVSVRTVQYYDSRNILVPTELSEGGRRLYSDADLDKLRIICFLRGLDLPINAIGDLLSEEHPEQVIHLLLDQQEQLLTDALTEKQEKLRKVQELRQNMNQIRNFSVEVIGDIAHVMEHKKTMRRIRTKLILFAIPFSVLEYGTFFYGIFQKVWWPFFAALIPILLCAVWVCRYYYTHIDYICPTCHTVFRPKFKDFFFSRHTPTTLDAVSIRGFQLNDGLGIQLHIFDQLTTNFAR